MILSMAGSEIFELSGSGVRAWALIASEPIASELLSSLVAEHDHGAEEIRAETVKLLEELQAAGLIEVDESG